MMKLSILKVSLLKIVTLLKWLLKVADLHLAQVICFMKTIC
jgi:hypothetical protein